MRKAGIVCLFKYETIYLSATMNNQRLPALIYHTLTLLALSASTITADIQACFILVLAISVINMHSSSKAHSAINFKADS